MGTKSLIQGNPLNIQIPIIAPPPEKGKSHVVGFATMHGHQGKELNLDGTQEIQYKHPHFGQGQKIIMTGGIT